jgi:hypothetical protein
VAYSRRSDGIRLPANIAASGSNIDTARERFAAFLVKGVGWMMCLGQPSSAIAVTVSALHLWVGLRSV